MLLNRLSSSSLLPKNKIIMLNNKQKELKIKWVEKNKNKKNQKQGGVQLSEIHDLYVSRQ